MTDINLYVTPEKLQSFIGSLTFTVTDIAFLAKIVVFTDSGDACYPTTSQKIIYDSGYFYTALTQGLDIGGKNYIVKISEDFQTMYSKKLSVAGTLKNFLTGFNSSTKNELIMLGVQNVAYGTYGTSGEYHYNYNFEVFHAVPAEHLYAIDAYNIGYWSSPTFYRHFPRDFVFDGSNNMLVVGLSDNVSRHNYIRYNSSGVAQFFGYSGIIDLRACIYANSLLYCTGLDYIQTINPSTDAVATTYQYSDSAQSSIRFTSIIEDSNGKIVATGYQLDGSGNYTGVLIQVESNLSALNYNVQIAETNNYVIYYGCCEYDGYIYSCGTAKDGSGNIIGIISQFSVADLSHAQSISITDTTSDYFLNYSVDSANGNLVLYGFAKNLSSNFEGFILKIETAIANLAGKSDSSGRFTFSSLSITETNPATKAWASSPKTMTTITPSSITTPTNNSSVSALTKTLYE